MNPGQLKSIVEAALLAADHPLSLDKLLFLFGEQDAPERKELRLLFLLQNHDVLFA